MKTVYFVRHGSTEGNEAGAYQHVHTPLSALGRRQAACVAHRFERIPVDIVIASDMERAAETGRCIAERNKFPIVFDPLFQEILRPAIVRGQRRDAPEVLEMMQLLAENWTNVRVKHSDEENFFDLKQRALKALDHLVARREKTVLVVTHGTFLCMLICCMMAGEEVSPPWFDHIHHFLVMKNTALSVCEYDQGKWQLVIWNDHAHLGRARQRGEDPIGQRSSIGMGPHERESQPHAALCGLDARPLPAHCPMESGMVSVGCSRCCCLLQQTCATRSPLALLAKNHVISLTLCATAQGDLQRRLRGEGLACLKAHTGI